MGERIEITINAEEALRALEHIDAKIEDTEDQLIDMAENVVKQTQESFNEVMGIMRASYMMVTGVSQAIGGNMSQIFSSMFSVALSSIGTYKAIAAALMVSPIPGARIEAALMFSSLTAALFNLGAAMTGQEELSRRISGLNTAIHGIGSIIQGAYFL